MVKLSKKKDEFQEEIDVDKFVHETIEDPRKLSWFTTGSIPMNLACSQQGKNGGIPRGRITNIVGDGSSGKTIYALDICANAHYKNPHSKHFPKTKKIKIHYNNPEEVMDFDINQMYGSSFNSEVIWKGIPTIEETGYDIAKTALTQKDDEGIIYIVDSWDALKSEKLFEDFEKISLGKAEKKGSYDLDKQKFGTREFFPNICKIMAGKDFTLIIISQTRDKIGSMFPEKVRTGGKALDFYTHLVVWLSQVDTLDKTVDGQKFVRGIKTRAKVKRSKVSKPYRESDTIITYDYGIDNISSCLNYLIKYGDSYSTKDLIEKVGLNEDMLPEKTISRVNLVKLIEENNLEDFISAKVEEIWLSRESKLMEERKSRF